MEKQLHTMAFVKVEEATLYTNPAVAPKIIGAAITEKTACWVGGWADGLIAVSKPPEELKKIVNALENMCVTRLT